ncbi:MAG: response regulator [Selenomonadaceae bacterium]|nr:response regulator [Selenomonadaceae bacterium]
MIRRGSSDSRARMSGGRPCAGCGRPIKGGLYCESCLEKFRERAKVQGERMEALKSNALKKVAEDRGEVVILIVNSDERNLSITKIVLERGLTDYKIITANNPLTMINTLLSREINLVVLDADYNGLDMLRRIREDNRFKSLPVMMMSGSTRREIVSDVFSLGVQDYVSKPCSPKDLVGRVNKLITGKEEPALSTAKPAKPAATVETSSKSSFRILLIDDDIFDLRQERESLQNRLPCEITSAQSAAEGMRLLENNGADLVLVSLDMPFINGLKFLSLVNNNPKLRSIPVIIMTETRDFAVVSEINKSSAAGHVKKPNFTENGLGFIESVLRKRR